MSDGNEKIGRVLGIIMASVTVSLFMAIVVLFLVWILLEIVSLY